MTWDKFIKPSKSEARYSDPLLREATFSIEPLERGFAQTLGGALRRVLMSSVPGSAITSIKIDGVAHEFSTIPGVKEDLPEIVLNLKSCRVSLKAGQMKHARIVMKGPGVVKARDIEASSDVVILDPEHVICTLSEKASINAELTIENGRGYVVAATQKEKNLPIGVIAIDALYSPIRMVNFRVEQTRVGQKTDYDKLVITIRTDGALSPDEALMKAAQILRDHFMIFSAHEGEAFDIDKDPVKAEELELARKLDMKVDELELSVRAMNCLKAANILTIRELVRIPEMELLRTPNFGRKSLNEIKEVLGSLGLKLDMNVPDLDPDLDALDMVE